MIRHLSRLTEGLDDALSQGALSASDLKLLQVMLCLILQECIRERVMQYSRSHHTRSIQHLIL